MNSLFRLAAEATAAAGRLTFQGFGDDAALSRPPVNPHLFGDDIAGRRTLIEVEVTTDFLDRALRFQIEGTGTEAAEELRAEAVAEAIRRFRKSPEAFGLTADEVDDFVSGVDLENTDVTFLFFEGRF